MKKGALTHNFAIKTVAFILCVISIFVLTISILTTYFMVSHDFYSLDEDSSICKCFDNTISNDSENIFRLFTENRRDELDTFYKYKNLKYELYLDDNLSPDYFDTATNKYCFNRNYKHYMDKNEYENEYDVYRVKCYIDKSFKHNDIYYKIYRLARLAYFLRYKIYIILALSGIISILLFIFLMKSAGKKKNVEKISPTAFTKPPFEIITALLVGYITLSCFTASRCWRLSSILITYTLVFISCISFIIAYCMNFAVRVKLGSWWKNTILFKIFNIPRKLYNRIKSLMPKSRKHKNIVWKTVGVCCIINFFSFFITSSLLKHFGESFFWGPPFFFRASLLILMPSCIVPSILAVFISFILLKLKSGGEALSKGDFSYKINTSKMFGNFKEHGENLNNIAQGMSKAVDEKLKSERLKTELITNVSHDIKTPLTSIVNYADLINKEDTENEKIKEYCQILLKQSGRLKRLTENLVEASKASTGNIDVNLAPCEVNVLLSQTVGEYEQKLTDNNLELITKHPDEPVKIMADGKILWRIFDNLLNNICKYSLSGTRVYLTIEEINQNVVISFKNISKTPLNISEDELMERFVRGDSSRNTQGNGLGLNIAKSLTNIQNGNLNLTIDGDLFKITLIFESI